jgi:YceI-like domain
MEKRKEKMTTEAATTTSTWTADPMHSIAEFAVKHFVVTTVKGRFRDLEATLQIDEANPENSSVPTTSSAPRDFRTSLFEAPAWSGWTTSASGSPAI